MMSKKMWRDMTRSRAQFVSIFLMAFLALFIYAGVGGEWRGLVQSADRFYADTNLADAWLYASGFTDDQAEAVRGIDGVTALERRLSFDVSAELAGSPRISVSFLERGEISKPYIVEGAPFDIDNPDGVWLDKRFADARGLAVGDDIGVTYMSIGIKKKIAGLVYSAEHVYISDEGTLTPDFADYGYAYLSHKASPMPGLMPYTTLMLKTDAGDAAALESRIADALDGRYGVYLPRADHPSVSMFHSETMQHKMMADVFPVVFLLIALLTMTTTMTRMVNNQRIQIGTLKALGFKKNTILRHYVFYGFSLALAGSALGMAAGPMTLPYLFYPSMSSVYTLPAWQPAFHASFAGMGVAMVLLCTFTCYAVCRRMLRETPAQCLRPKAPRAFRHGALERIRGWERLGFNVQWNARDAARNKIRSLMAIVGVMGCAALVVCALGMYDSMADLKRWQYVEINRFESKLSLNESITPKQLDAVVASVDGECIMEEAASLSANGIRKTGAILVTDDVTLIAPTDAALRSMALPEDGLSMSLKMAEALGVKQGDMFEWSVYGSETRLQSAVDAIYREPVNQGIAMTRAHWESLDLAFHATSVLSARAVDGPFDGVDRIQSTSSLIAGWDELTEALNMMASLLIAAAVVLSVVVLYNLGLMSFAEVEREMATLKVMGMKTGLLRRLLLTQNLWFSGIGYVLGVPAGMALLRAVIAFSGDTFDFPIRLHLTTVAISFAFTFGLSILVNRMFSKKIRRLNMVEALKAIE